MTVKLINSEASVNSFIYLDSVSYSPGETLDLNFVFWNQEQNIRYVLEDPSAVVTATLLKTDETELIKTLTPMAPTTDRSMWSFSLDTTETLDLATSNIMFKLDLLGDGSVIKLISARGLLSKTLNGGDCC